MNLLELLLTGKPCRPEHAGFYVVICCLQKAVIELTNAVPYEAYMSFMDVTCLALQRSCTWCYSYRKRAPVHMILPCDDQASDNPQITHLRLYR